MIEVIIPAARGNLCERLVWSLARQTVKPDLVSVVGNEATHIESYGLDVDLVRYSSEEYPPGQIDVCLRRNVGAYTSQAETLIFQDDDQMAPPDLIETSLEYIEREGYVWGHHRYIEFGDDPRAIVDLPPSAGRSRETEANRHHLWQSGYAGNFGVRRHLFLEVGGFDMAFHGHRGSEDQQFCRRLLLYMHHSTVYVPEPPFAWHPTEEPSIGHGQHQSQEVVMSDHAVVPFELSRVAVSKERQ